MLIARSACYPMTHIHDYDDKNLVERVRSISLIDGLQLELFKVAGRFFVNRGEVSIL